MSKNTSAAVRVLLVEDNEDDYILVRDLLGDIATGTFDLERVETYQAAREALERRRYDVCFLDYHLGQATGVEIVREYASKGTPFILLTDNEDYEADVAATKAGAADYLLKGHINAPLVERSIRYAIGRQESQQSLRASETRYRRLFESAQDGILILDAATRKITDVNPYMMELLEYSRAEFLGKEVWEIGLLEDAQASAGAFRELQENGYIRYEDLPLQTKSGKKRDVEFVSNVYGQNGHTVIQCNIRDISERKRAQRAEHDSQRFLQSTLDALGSHIAVLDETGKIIAVNGAWRQFAAQNQGSVAACEVGANYLEVCAQAQGAWAEEGPSVVRGIQQVMAGHQPTFCQEYPCHSPSEERWFNVCVTPFSGEGPVRVVVAHENITARKLIEAQIRESAANLASAQHIAHLGSWEKDLSDLEALDATPLHWSDEVFRIFGLEQGETEVSFDTFVRAVHPDDRERVSAAIFPSIANGTPYSLDHRIILPDGNERIVHEQAEVIYDASGTPLKMVGTVQDITQRKRVENALRQSEARSSAVIQHALDCIITIDHGARVVEFNPAAEATFGYTRAEALGRHLNDLIVLFAFHGAHDGGIAHYLETGEAPMLNRRVEVPARRKDGTQITIELAATAVAHCDPPVFIAYLRDITQRKQAEEELRASEARFQSIVANVPGMVFQFMLRPDGSVAWPFISEGCRELYEADPQTIQRTPLLPIDMIEPSDRREFDRSIAVSAQRLSPWSWEGRVKAASGKTKWVQGTGRPQRLPDGSTLWDGLVMDITARKEAETERDRFFTLSLDMMAIADSDGYFKRLNPAFEATLGFSNAELLSMPFLDLVHPEDLSATQAFQRKIDSGATLLQFVNRIRCRDGSYKWLSWRTVPFENLYYVVAHDISKIKKAEAALHKANDELELRVMERTAELAEANESLGAEIVERQMTLSALRGAMEALQKAKAEEDLAHEKAEFLSRQNQLILNSAGEGIFGLDTAGQVTFINPEACQLLGQPWGDLVGQSSHALFHHTRPDGEAYPREESPLLASCTHGVMHHSDNEVFWRQDGTSFPIEYTSTPIREGEGVIGAVVTFRDITERRQAEQDLRLAIEAADSANRAKSEFLSRMSHELRTPLNAILGFGQILEMRDLGPKESEGITQILRAGRHLLQLINEVLDIARIEAGHLSLSREPLEVAATLRESLDLVRPLAAAQNIELVAAFDGEGTQDWHVLADRQRLHQVLINLLSNAIKYNREAGSVTLRCALVEADDASSRLRIEVSDSGYGLAPADLKRLFVPFERLGAERSTVEGTGIGLALCKRLVEAMEGRIGALSEVQQGSTFWLELPLAERSSMLLDPPDENSALPVTLQNLALMTRPATLLHIEDNVLNLKVVERLLADFPHLKLLTAMQGGMGVELAKQHQPDLILLDIHLPDILGDEVLSRLQFSAATRDIPVVILSADATAKRIEKLLATGARNYLTKPLDIKELLHVVEEILRERT